MQTARAYAHTAYAYAKHEHAEGGRVKRREGYTNKGIEAPTTGRGDSHSPQPPRVVSLLGTCNPANTCDVRLAFHLQDALDH